MIKVDKNKVYESHGYSYRNFVVLDSIEKNLVFEWRNSENVRKWMYNQNVIEYNDHIRFLESLDSRDDCYYWLVYKDNKPVGVYDVTNIDRVNNTAENGLYLDPISQDSGTGFDFVKECFFFFFGVLDLERAVGGAVASNKNIIYLDQYFGFEFTSKRVERIGNESVEFWYSDNLTKDIFLDRYRNSSQKDFIRWYRINKKK